MCIEEGAELFFFSRPVVPGICKCDVTPSDLSLLKL